MVFQQGEKQLRHPVVNHAFIFDGATLLGVERSRVVLEIGDYVVGVRRRVELLRLALIKHFELCGRAFQSSLLQLVYPFILRGAGPWANEHGSRREFNVHRPAIESTMRASL